MCIKNKLYISTCPKLYAWNFTTEDTLKIGLHKIGNFGKYLVYQSYQNIVNESNHFVNTTTIVHKAFEFSSATQILENLALKSKRSWNLRYLEHAYCLSTSDDTAKSKSAEILYFSYTLLNLKSFSSPMFVCLYGFRPTFRLLLRYFT